MAEETTMREFGRDLAHLEGRYEVEMRAVKDTLGKQDEKLDTIIGMVHDLKLTRAETQGRDRTLMWAGSGVIAIGMSWLSKHLGLN